MGPLSPVSTLSWQFLDYLTIAKGVAFTTTNLRQFRLAEIDVVHDWGPQMRNTPKIPSIISYSPASPTGEQQWGYSLSKDAVAMTNTKLELDVQDDRLDELELTLKLLEGTSNLQFNHVRVSSGFPEYTWKEPEEIVTDYLTKVFQSVSQDSPIGIALGLNLPVDIVITVPAVWQPVLFLSQLLTRV